MGILDKRIADITLGDLLTLDILRRIFGGVFKRRARDETKGLPPGHPLRVWKEIEPYNPAQARLIRSLREMRKYGQTPEGGWDNWKWQELKRFWEDVTETTPWVDL